MLMPVQFPNDLVVSYFVKVEKIDLEPGSKRSPPPVHDIEMPVDLGSILQISIAEKAKAMGTNLVGFAYNLCRLRAETCPYQISAPWQLFLSEEEFPARPQGFPKAVGGWQTGAVEGKIQPFADFLPGPRLHFFPAHAAQPRPGLSPP